MVPSLAASCVVSPPPIMSHRDVSPLFSVPQVSLFFPARELFRTGDPYVVREADPCYLEPCHLTFFFPLKVEKCRLFVSRPFVSFHVDVNIHLSPSALWIHFALSSRCL